MIKFSTDSVNRSYNSLIPLSFNDGMILSICTDHFLTPQVMRDRNIWKFVNLTELGPKCVAPDGCDHGGITSEDLLIVHLEIRHIAQQTHHN
jgi:hypothetical protein